MSKRLIVSILVVLINLLVSVSTFSEQKTIEANQAKTAFIYNILKFVEYPIKIDTVNLCIIGEDEINHSLKTLDGKQTSDKKIYVSFMDSTKDLTKCNAIFVNESVESKLDYIIARIRNLPILTISDSENFIEFGIMVNMFVSDEKLKFNVNNKMVKEANLKISSRVLTLASKIYD